MSNTSTAHLDILLSATELAGEVCNMAGEVVDNPRSCAGEKEIIKQFNVMMINYK